jgi:exonuclease SbcC
MLIKSLRLKNFGSFRDVYIEFPTSGIFLISGKTGSGKSTILEAISFALFKRIPRYGSDDDAPFRELPFKLSIDKNKLSYSLVELDFFIKSDLYKIKREWKYDYKKYDYKNRKVKEHNVEIYKNNEPLAVKVQAVENEILKILGFEATKNAYENFTKTVFLPQNQFDKFLINSKPTERESILLDLFNLNLYYEIKEKVSTQFKELKNKIENLNNNINFIKNRITQDLDLFFNNIKKLKEIIVNFDYTELQSINFIDLLSNLDNLDVITILDNLDSLNVFYQDLEKIKNSLSIIFGEIIKIIQFITNNYNYLRELKNKINEIFINFNIDNDLNEIELFLDKIRNSNLVSFLEYEEGDLKNKIDLLNSNRDLLNKILNIIDSLNLELSNKINYLQDYLLKIQTIYLDFKQKNREKIELIDFNFENFTASINQFVLIKSNFEKEKEINLANLLNKIADSIRRLELKVNQFTDKYKDFLEILNNINNLNKYIEEIKKQLEIKRKQLEELQNQLDILKTKKEYLEKILELDAYINYIRDHILKQKLNKCLVCENKITNFSILKNINLSQKEKEKIDIEEEIKQKEKYLQKSNTELSKINGTLESKLNELSSYSNKLRKFYKEILGLIEYSCNDFKDLNQAIIYLFDFFEYFKNNDQKNLIYQLLKDSNEFIAKAVDKVSKIIEMLNSKLLKLSDNNLFDEQDSIDTKKIDIIQTLQEKFFSRLKQQNFLDNINKNIVFIADLFSNFELLNLASYINNVKFIFEDIKNRLKSLKEDLLNLSKKGINNENDSIYFEEFLDYLNKLLEFKLNYNNNKDEIKSKFQDFNNKLFNIQADFKEKLKNIDYHIEILEDIINLKDNINKIKKEVLDTKLVKLKDLIDNFSFSLSLSISSNFNDIYSNFEDFIIKQDNLVKKISVLKEVNQNLNEFKNNLLNQLEEMEKDLNIKKDNLVSLKSDILNYTEKLDLIFYNLDELKSNYKELEKIQEDYVLIEELNNDFSAKSAKSGTDLISFLSTKLFDLLYFSTNKIIENLTEGRYNLFISKGGDIFIRDNWYNVDRGIKSLSGGERFLTSLSLALAISEISSKSKYPIKSLFIDEGFSTLDIDTLNDVMDYLENYFNNVSDKVLGIITHIPEVKDKFNYIIEVIKDKNGSKVNIINKITV